MKIEPELVVELCERAGVRGRPRQVLELLAADVPSEDIARQLEIAPASVHVYAHRARTRIARAQARWAEWDLHRFVLREAILGPAVSNPREALYRELGPGQGERVRLHGLIVVEEDLRRR